MRLLAIGDTHGHPTWKKIVEKNTFDKFVFIGDYFDSYGAIKPLDQIKNFNEIIEFKLSQPDKVICLTGNHDYHYLRTTNETYSGFQHAHKVDIANVIHNALDKEALQMCYVSGNYLFSHAGLTKTWCANNEIDLENIESSVNDLFKYKPNAFRFTVGDNFDQYGDDVCQPPIWVRPRSLVKNAVDGFTQVVGHTTVKAIATNLGIGVILIDALGTSREFIAIEDNEVSVLTVENNEVS